MSTPLVAGLAALLFALVLVSFYPGQTNLDSNAQLHQIATGKYNDWHPPGLARLWQLLLFLKSEPASAPLFVFNLLCYWAGILLVALEQLRLRRRWTALACLAAGAAPLFLMLLSRITKDANVAATMILGFGLLLTGMRRHRRAGVIALVGPGAVMLLFALHVRHNAVFAVGPLLAMLVAWRRPEIGRRPLLLMPAALALSAVLIPVVSFTNHRLLGAAEAHPIESLELFDVAGVANGTGDMTVFGGRSAITHQDVERCYTPTLWDSLAPWGHCGDFAARAGVEIANQDDAGVRRSEKNELAAVWPEAVTRYPVAYALHRLSYFNRAAYGFGSLKDGDVAFENDADDFVNHRYRGSRALYQLRYGAVFTPAFLMALGLALLPFMVIAARRSRSVPGNPAIYLCTSGLAFGLSYLVVGVATEPRYFFYSSLALLLAAVLALGDPLFRRVLADHRRTALIAALILAGFAITQTLSRSTEERSGATLAKAPSSPQPEHPVRPVS